MIAKTYAPVARCRAGIAMWLVRTYAADIAAFYAGDVGRFERMVGSSGKSIANATPQGWAALMARNMDDATVQALYGTECAGYRRQLADLGL